MRRAALVCIVTLVVVASARGFAIDPFAVPLAAEKRVIHALNRLTYGLRASELANAKAAGITSWMRRQLQPERIPENASLLKRLEPLESTRLQTAVIFEKYSNVALSVPGPRPLAQLLPAAMIARLENGTVEERREILAALPGDLRKEVLLVVPPKTFDGLEAVRTEAFSLRFVANEERTALQRKLRPPIAQIVTQDQLRVLTGGNADEKMTLIAALDSEKRAQLLRQFPPGLLPDALRREAIRLGQPAQLPLVELIDAKLYRAIYSNRQLEEVLVDFWLNHFNVFSGKGPVRTFLTSYERDAIRPHVFGRFRDMVLATARHPAMLFYLDNWQSQVPGASPAPPVGTAPPTAAGLNENYGRELLELHTLGVDGGYTQADVVAVARAFTGWTIYEPNRYGEFFFNPAMHDRGDKVVLGHQISRGGGESDGLAVIDILVRHPSTARFISRKLARRFVADDPPAALVTRMASTFTRTGGDLRATVETMLLSPEFMSEGSWKAKVKSPLELVVSALRALDADVTDTMPLAQRLAELGQPIYGKLEPTGYSDVGESWISSASVAARISLITALTSGQVHAVTVDTRALPPSPTAAARHVFGVTPPGSMLTALGRAPRGALPSDTLAALLLASPEFQKR